VIALAYEAGNRAHAASKQIDQEAIALGIVVVRIAADREQRIGAQRHQAAIGEPDLHTPFRAGRDRVAGLERSASGDFFRDLSAAQGGIASRELGDAGRGVRCPRVCQCQRDDKNRVLEPE
jgi:hypothetical protein